MSIWNRIERRLSELADELMPDDLREQLIRAREQLESGETDEAVELLEVLVDARPEHPGALSLLGAAYLEQGRAETALTMFDRALAARGDLPEAAIGRGQAALALGDLEQAIASFRRAIDDAGGDRPVLAAGYAGLGMSHRCAGDIDKAIRELRKSVAEAPKDAFALAALGEAMLAHPETPNSEARKYLSWALEQESAPALAFIAMGTICLAEGDETAAKDHFATAVQVAEASGQTIELVDALLGAGDTSARANNSADAHASYLRALELSPKRAEIHARIAELHGGLANWQAALGSYQYALELGAGPEVLRRALATALSAGDEAAALPLASQLLAIDPNSSLGLVAKARTMPPERADEATELYERAIAAGNPLEAHIGLAKLALARSDAAAAATHARAALREAPAEPRARELLSLSRQRELGTAVDVGQGDNGMYQLALALHRITLLRPSLGELSGAVAHAAADFDRPLLLTVMGEFSSGKSTFVNAFIGSDVAPTGITPTTATINVVKYGRERGGRILYRDGRIETLGWDALFAALRGFDENQARDIELVEILLPLEALERVNIVDTPGLNSILPEHQAVARSFIERADAVVWLFSAAQAGKASEKQALDEIQKAGKRVLGVLNKVDQLSDDQLQQIQTHLDGELAGRLEALVPVSARNAVADPSDERWGTLLTELEQRFFSHAREIKRQACSIRLGELLTKSAQIATRDVRAAADTAVTLRQSADDLRTAGAAFEADVGAVERRALHIRVGKLYRTAAIEVLELVQPRKLPFGSHSATRADRDYLLSLLETGYGAALHRSRTVVDDWMMSAINEATAELATTASVIGGDPEREIRALTQDALELVAAQVFVRCQAYLRGYLHGGYVERFFRSDLPKLELTEDAVFHALNRDSANLDRQFAEPLVRAVTNALSLVEARLRSMASGAEVIAFDFEVGLVAALAGLDNARAELVG